MVLVKSLNNNVAMVLDDNGTESIVIGRGISYKKRDGDQIDRTAADKVFVLQDKNCQSRLLNIIQDIPLEYLLAVEEIVEMIKEDGANPSDMIYVTLVDHISVSIEGEKNRDFYENPLLADIKAFYKKEYELAQRANDIIERHFGIRVSEDELGFIALHIANALSHADLADTVQMTRSVSEIIQIIESVYNHSFDKTAIRYERLVRHLMFLIRRILSDEQEQSLELPFLYKKDRHLSKCIERIDSYLYGKYGSHMQKNEKDYLKYHILVITLKGEE